MPAIPFELHGLKRNHCLKLQHFVTQNDPQKHGTMCGITVYLNLETFNWRGRILDVKDKSHNSEGQEDNKRGAQNGKKWNKLWRSSATHGDLVAFAEWPPVSLY